MREKAKEGQVHYNPQNDTLYFLVQDGEEERFVAVAEGVNVELDQKGQLLSLEILNASRFLRATIGPSAMLRTSPERLARLARLKLSQEEHDNEPLKAWQRTWQAMTTVLEGAGGRKI